MMNGDTLRAIRLLQHNSDSIEQIQDDIGSEIRDVKAKLRELGPVDESSVIFEVTKRNEIAAMSQQKEIPNVELKDIVLESKKLFPENITLNNILTPTDWQITNKRLKAHIADFNGRYALDKWDYAIAGGCGLFAAMLDLLCVNAPRKPSSSWTTNIDGVFNRGVQSAFNRMLPPDVSDRLGSLNTIGAADTSTTGGLIGAVPRALSPMNHRLRSLSHDPLFGFLFGVLDMMRGTCTVVGSDGLKIYPTTSKPVVGSLFPLLGRMFGHLCSDVNAPSSRGNRGMGLPAPFMGLLRMVGRFPVGEAELGKQIEFMYVNGYDFRQFVATSIPLLIMEVMMRVFLRRQAIHDSRSFLGSVIE